ncbi:acyltransferase family protein [Sphingomonas sp.]|uniref:acyltransferase family protein n=1 Tax=Sphingomonas sp. TaxID=28214 RepID=UPI003B009BC8
MLRQAQHERNVEAAAGPPVGQAIGIARVLCILGIVYVHAWTGRDGDTLLALSQSSGGIVRWTLIELVGRSAVPLLGAISGWLAAPSAERRGARGFARTKTRTVLAPMIAWNGIALALVSSAATWGHLRAPVPHRAAELVEWLTCATEPNPINVQIGFLRDLYLCLLVAPWLARRSDRTLGLLLLAVTAWTVSGETLTVLLRPQIALFFLAGLLARRHGLAEQVAGWRLLPTLLPYVLLAAVKILLSVEAARWLLDHVAAADAFDLPLRVAAAVAMWRIALALVPTALGRAALGVERYAFLLFCAHLCFIWLLGPVIGLATGPLGSSGYLPYLLVQPLLALGATMLLGRLLIATAPRLANLLSGGRLARDLPHASSSAMEPAPIGSLE